MDIDNALIYASSNFPVRTLAKDNSEAGKDIRFGIRNRANQKTLTFKRILSIIISWSSHTKTNLDSCQQTTLSYVKPGPSLTLKQKKRRGKKGLTEKIFQGFKLSLFFCRLKSPAALWQKKPTKPTKLTKYTKFTLTLWWQLFKSSLTTF